MKTSIEIINPPALTNSEINALKGLIAFNKAYNDTENDPHTDECILGEFCYRANELFSEIRDFQNSCFKSNSGLSRLADVYRDAIEANPHLAKQYFYDYSQISKVLTSIYSERDLIQQIADTFEGLSKKLEYIEL